MPGLALMMAFFVEFFALFSILFWGHHPKYSRSPAATQILTSFLEGVSVYAATGVCDHFLLLSVHSRKHVLRKSKSSLRKMDNKVIKRGRPKGAEQTVIILQERSSKKNRK